MVKTDPVPIQDLEVDPDLNQKADQGLDLFPDQGLGPGADHVHNPGPDHRVNHPKGLEDRHLDQGRILLVVGAELDQRRVLGKQMK